MEQESKEPNGMQYDIEKGAAERKTECDMYNKKEAKYMKCVGV